MSKGALTQPLTGVNKTGICLSCGEPGIKPRRRYCSKECRQQMLWVLSLSKGLLKIFNARYASFSFDRNHVILDILPVWSKDISRFIQERTSGKKPAEDFKNLILQYGREWHHTISNNNSKSYASFLLLKKNFNGKISAGTIRPSHKLRPRFSRHEKESVKLLQLGLNELIAEGHTTKIKSAYKKLAKIHHPDMGGDTEKFKRLNEAHQQMLLWAKNPHFTTRRALIDCWSYDSSTNRWAPPL
ncbi:DnaJ domain-containing protein [Deltaproteobacteria bacterium]|nr:DnaJ domain-containing protein [Deltaproteobacteria bacterium]